MKRKEKIFPWKEILDLKDEEFCKKLEVTTEVKKILEKSGFSNFYIKNLGIGKS